MNPRSIDHFIVSGTNWDDQAPLMRRNRLALFLKDCPTTHEVYWIGMTRIGFRRFRAQYDEMRAASKCLRNGVQQISLPDIRSWLRYGGGVNLVLRLYGAQLLVRERPRVLWFTNPSFSPLIKLGGWDKIVYDCSDYWCRPPTARRKRLTEERIARRSDLLFGSSKYLVDLLKRQFNRDSVLVENGVDYHTFASATPAELTHIPHPRLGFLGALKSIVDFRLLAEMLARFDRASLVLLGQAVDVQNPSLKELLRHPRVHHLPPVSSSRVPAFAKALDVGLCPYRAEDAFTAGGFPLKFFEYLAAGLPVVGHGQPATKGYSEDGVYLYAESYSEFMDQVQRALVVKSDPRLIERRRRLASQHDWSIKFAIMTRLLLLE